MKAEDIKSNVMEHSSKYGFVHQSEDEKLLQDITRPYTEKLQLFTKMLKRNKILHKANIALKY